MAIVIKRVGVWLVVVLAAAAGAVPAVAQEPEAPAPSRPALAPQAVAPLAFAAVTDGVEVGDQARVGILMRSPGRCVLRLTGPKNLSSGPFRARLTKRFGEWSWKVPSAVRGGSWTAKVKCATRRKKTAVATTRIDVAFDPAGRRSIAPTSGVRFRTMSSPPLPPGAPAVAGKGASAGYPHDNAVCKWTGLRNGACRNYDWGYRQSNGTWALLSQRGFYYRNCTDFAAWATGLTWPAFRFPGGVGHAANWNEYAANAGLQVKQSAAVGDVAGWESPAPWGHVAVVAAVNANGTVTTVDYNGDARGNYTVRTNTRADWYLHRPGGNNTPSGNAPGASNPQPSWTGGNRDLWFVKTKSPGSGRVEVHSATAASGYQSGQHSVSWFSPGDADNGWFQMVGNNLFFIKTRNTGSGRVEVHSATAASGYQNGQHSVTWFSPGDASNGWFQMVGGDLFFIKTRNTGSGRVEVHSATAASGYQSGQHSVTWFSPGDASNGFFQMVGGDLFFAKTKNVGSGHVEVHSATAGSGYQTGQHSVTWLSPGDADNGWFQMVGSELFFAKTKNVGSGHVEVHSATAGSGYQTGQHSVTWLSPGDANNGWFQVAGSKG